MPRLSLWDKRKIFWVYALIDPFNNEYFYVGSGTSRRANDHLSEAKNNKVNNQGANLHKINKIKRILASGNEPKVEYLYATPSRNEAFTVETLYIGELGRRDLGTGPLTNLTDGGEGLVNRSNKTIKLNTERAKQTKGNWSDKQRKDFQNKISSYQKRRWERYSEQEKHDNTDHLRHFWQNIEPDKASEINKRPWLDKDYNQRLEYTKPARAKAQEYKEQNKEEFSRRTSIGTKASWAKLTPEQKSLRGKKIQLSRISNRLERAYSMNVEGVTKCQG